MGVIFKSKNAEENFYSPDFYWGHSLIFDCERKQGNVEHLTPNLYLYIALL